MCLRFRSCISLGFRSWPSKRCPTISPLNNFGLSPLSVAAAGMKGLNWLLLSGSRCRPGDQDVESFMASHLHVSHIPLALRHTLPSGRSIWKTGCEREGHAQAEMCNKIGDNISSHPSPVPSEVIAQRSLSTANERHRLRPNTAH